MAQRIGLKVQPVVRPLVARRLVAEACFATFLAVGELHVVRHEAQVKHVGRALHLGAIHLVIHVPRARLAVERGHRVVVAQTLQLVLAQRILVKLAALVHLEERPGVLLVLLLVTRPGPALRVLKDLPRRAVPVLLRHALLAEIGRVHAHRKHLATHARERHMRAAALALRHLGGGERVPRGARRDDTREHLEQVPGVHMVPVHVDHGQAPRVIATLHVALLLLRRLRLAVQLLHRVQVQPFVLVEVHLVQTLLLCATHSIAPPNNNVTILVLIFILLLLFLLFAAALEVALATGQVDPRRLLVTLGLGGIALAVVHAVDPAQILLLRRGRHAVLAPAEPVDGERIGAFATGAEHVPEPLVERDLGVVVLRLAEARVCVHPREPRVAHGRRARWRLPGALAFLLLRHRGSGAECSRKKK